RPGSAGAGRGGPRGGGAGGGAGRPRGAPAGDAAGLRRRPLDVEVRRPPAQRSEALVRLWLTHEDHSVEAEVETRGEHLVLTLGGRRFEADFVRLPDGHVYSLLVDGKSYELTVARTEEGVGVTHHGTVIPIEVRHPLEKLLLAQLKTSTGGGGEPITAPMPGLLVQYRVRPGDVVQPGQSVAVVEAMKMHNELTARRGGVVRDLLVAES